MSILPKTPIPTITTWRDLFRGGHGGGDDDDVDGCEDHRSSIYGLKKYPLNSFDWNAMDEQEMHQPLLFDAVDCRSLSGRHWVLTAILARIVTRKKDHCKSSEAVNWDVDPQILATLMTMTGHGLLIYDLEVNRRLRRDDRPRGHCLLMD